MAINLKIDGFEQLLKDIEKAGGSINAACDSAIRQSAQIMQAELKAEMKSAGVDSGLIDAMPPFEIEVQGNQYGARVGYKKGVYNPADPSDGYKAVFLNYGTPHRTKHGKVTARGFIEKAKEQARPKIKKAQKQALSKVLERLKK